MPHSLSFTEKRGDTLLAVIFLGYSDGTTNRSMTLQEVNSIMAQFPKILMQVRSTEDSAETLLELRSENNEINIVPDYALGNNTTAPALVIRASATKMDFTTVSARGTDALYDIQFYGGSGGTKTWMEGSLSVTKDISRGT